MGRSCQDSQDVDCLFCNLSPGRHRRGFFILTCLKSGGSFSGPPRTCSCFSFARPPEMLWSACLSTGPVSHEQKLSKSLEIALTSTLGSMPCFTARLSRGQLQQLGTRGSGAARRPAASSGKLCSGISLCGMWACRFLFCGPAEPAPLA